MILYLWVWMEYQSEANGFRFGSFLFFLDFWPFGLRRRFDEVSFHCVSAIIILLQESPCLYLFESPDNILLLTESLWPMSMIKRNWCFRICLFRFVADYWLPFSLIWSCFIAFFLLQNFIWRSWLAVMSEQERFGKLIRRLLYAPEVCLNVRDVVKWDPAPNANLAIWI